MVEKCINDFEDKYLDLLILFLFPLVQVFINSNWIFNPIKALPIAPFQDTWFYNGNFFYFFDYVSEGLTSTHYFVERLPLNIPGYYLYHLLSPLKANYILHLAYYYIAIFSLYAILRSLLNKRSALIASLAMGSYPWFLRAVGWDYVDGTGIAYYSLSMALMVAASKQRHWRPFSFGAGIATACLIYTNLFWIPFVLILVLFYIALNRLYNKTNLLLSGLFYFLGGLTITAIFSGFYYFASGRLLFFEHSVKSVFYISKSSTLLPLLKYMYFPMEPYWLILPILFFISFCLLLALKKLNLNDKTNFIKIILLIQFCLTFGFLVFWHIFFQPYLRIFLYMSYVIPSTFLLFGAMISNPLEKLTDRQFYFVSAGSIAVFLAPLGLTLSSQYFDNFLRLQDNVIFLALGILVLIGSLLLQNRFSVIIACAAIAAIGFIGGADANVYIQDRWKGQENFVAVAKAVNAINEVYPDNDQKLKVMYDNLNFDIPAVAIGGIYLDLSGHGYKENDPVGWDAITSLNNKKTVLISQKGNAYHRLMKQFSEYSETVQFKLRADIPIESGKIRFHLFLFDTYVQKQDHLYPGETFEFNVPFDGKNFYDLEENQGITYIWSGPGTEAQMRFKLGVTDEDKKLSICVHALQPEIMDSFQLHINNVHIPTMKSSDANCPSLVTAIIPKTIFNKNSSDSTVFTFRVNKTASPYELGINADGRKLGLSFDWIRIE